MRPHLPVSLLLAAATLLVVGDAHAADASLPERCAGRVATIVGTDWGDVIVGTPGDDVIAALDGNDRIRGRGGADVICGGPGSDLLEGGHGPDRLYGGLDLHYPRHCDTYIVGDRILPGPGNDYVDAGEDPRQQSSCTQLPDRVSFRRASHGIRADLADPGQQGEVRGEGHDVVIGERALDVEGTRYDDVVAGGAGDELLRGLGGTDVLSGGAGDDRLIDDDTDPGVGAGDRLSGGSGADSLWSAWGPDVLAGDEDDDVVFADLSCTVVLGGPGRDQLNLNGAHVPTGTASVRVDASAGTVAALPGQPACGRLSDFESYGVFAAVPIEFVGTEGPDELHANGNDGVTAHLLGGDDVVVGTSADDVIDAGDGVDDVSGRSRVGTSAWVPSRQPAASTTPCRCRPPRARG